MHETLNAPITGSVAWLGREMASSTEWIRLFAGREIDEIDAALRGVQRRGLGWPGFGRDEFPLPTFARELRGVLDELEDGRGFVLMRGFPVERYTEDELKDVYWGVSAHLGAHRYQNASGELIGEVRDENRRYGNVREGTMDPALGRSSRNKARSAGPLRFHEDADGADQDRLLLRLWLATPNSRALPPSYVPIWGTTASGVPRGGIAQPAASV